MKDVNVVLELTVPIEVSDQEVKAFVEAAVLYYYNKVDSFECRAMQDISIEMTNVSHIADGILDASKMLGAGFRDLTAVEPYPYMGSVRQHEDSGDWGE